MDEFPTLGTLTYLDENDGYVKRVLFNIETMEIVKHKQLHGGEYMETDMDSRLRLEPGKSSWFEGYRDIDYSIVMHENQKRLQCFLDYKRDKNPCIYRRRLNDISYIPAGVYEGWWRFIG